MKLRLVILSALLLAQWAVPLYMVAQQEKVLAEGKEFKFKLSPVDPTDPFRGSYISLYFANARFERDSVADLPERGRVYVSLVIDSSGYAVIDNISTSAPKAGDYVTANIEGSFYHKQGTTRQFIRIRYPFEEFYLPQAKAKQAEHDFRYTRDAHVAYAKVWLLNGAAQIEDVLIDGRSVRDIVKEANEKKE